MKITQVEIATATNGNEYKKVTLEDGKTFNVFSDHSRYNEIIMDFDLNPADLVKVGKYTNLVDPKAKPKGGGAKQAGITQNMEKKANSIILAGSARDATMIALEEMKTYNPESIDWDAKFKERWLLWRSWLIKNAGNSSDVTETTQPF